MATPLHSHSHYSALDGLAKPSEMAARCAELGFASCGLTDHDVVAGHSDFYHEMIKAGIKPILGHSMPLAAVGVFLLFFGWFGFNGGSVLSAAPGPLGLVFTTTALAASTGALGAIIVSWIVLKKPDLSMTLNGFLAGLVGITASADIVSPTGAMIIGLIAGIIVVFSVLFFDKIRIDDPVGAISVHGVCGVWGILAVAIFEVVGEGAEKQYFIGGQLMGVLAVGAAAFVFSFVVFLILKMTIGIRVSEEEEHEGLDVAEHGAPAYHIS